MDTKLENFKVKTATTEAEVKQVYAFAESVLGNSGDTVHTLAYYLDHFQKTPGLLVFAEKEGRVVGSTLGSIEEDHILVGSVAVAPDARRLGIGAAMMSRLEEEARKLNQTTLILGAKQEAETFYLYCGFRPNLFIQLFQGGQLEALKALNEAWKGGQYPVVWEADEDGFTRLMLGMSQVDRDLQSEYGQRFPGCATQYVFIKELG